MTVDRQHRKIIFECDTCDAIVEGLEGDEFDAAWADTKVLGWTARRIVGEWMHFCHRCSKEGKNR